MRTKYLSLLFLLFLFLSQGCESDLLIEKKIQPPLINVEGILKQNIPGTMDIVKSVPYDSTYVKPEIVKDAFVQLLGNNGNVLDIFEYKGIKVSTLFNGYRIIYRYFSKNSFMPEPGNEYILKLSVPGYGEITSSTFIPYPVPIISVDTNSTYISDDRYTYKVLECTIKFYDPPQEKNYYRIEISGGSNNANNLYSLDDKVISMKENNNYSQGFISLEAEEDHIMFVPDVFSSDASYNGKMTEIKVYIDIQSNYFIKGVAKTNKLRVKLYSINEDYYRYSESLFKQLKKRNDIFSEPVRVYSNISNGVGIFSGESVSIDSSIMVTVK